MKNKIDFRCEAKDNKVYLYGSVVDNDNWLWGDEKENYIYPKNVKKLVDEIKGDEIELHINSYGGSVFAGIAIYHILKNSGKKITAYIDGVCASAATFILMGASTIFMPENTQLLVHRASTFGWGNCKDLRAIADDLDHLDQTTLVPTYKARFTGSEEDLLELLDKDEWLDANKAKEYGFVDEIIKLEKPQEEPEEDKNKETENTNNEDIENVGKRLLAFASAFNKFKEKGELKNEEI